VKCVVTGSLFQRAALHTEKIDRRGRIGFEHLGAVDVVHAACTTLGGPAPACSPSGQI
jgi:hypothetical protein